MADGRLASRLLTLRLLSPSVRPPLPLFTPATLLSLYGTRIRNASSSSKRKFPPARRSQLRNSNAMRVAMQAKQLEQQASSILLPKTVVPTPIWAWPSLLSPRVFVQHVVMTARAWVERWGTLVYLKMILSGSKIFGKKKLKLNRGSIVPLAKALYVAMNEALARGDKETLRMVCRRELADALCGTVDQRPRGETAKWKLLGYEHEWLGYPKLADDQFMQIPKTTGEDGRPRQLSTDPYTRQVVVSIASRQRIARFDYQKREIVGSEKEKSVLEHVVMQVEVDPQTWQQTGDWKIWGMVPATTWEDWTTQRERLRQLRDLNTR